MSYRVDGSGDISIPQENIPAALEALKALNKRDDLKSGVRWANGSAVQCFLNMEPDYDQRCDFIADVFHMLGFDQCLLDDEYGFQVGWYSGSWGDLSVFLIAIAPYVREGSLYTWSGDDGMSWQTSYTNGNMYEAEGHIVYGTPVMHTLEGM